MKHDTPKSQREGWREEFKPSRFAFVLLRWAPDSTKQTPSMGHRTDSVIPNGARTPNRLPRPRDPGGVRVGLALASGYDLSLRFCFSGM